MYIRETSDNGDYFEGSVNVFREAEGRGMCRYANGNVYEGNWQKDNWNGDGVLTYVNGFRFEGTFRDGYFEGDFRITAPDGTVIRCRFHNGYTDDNGYLVGLTGTGVIDYLNGALHYEGEINGLLQPHGYGTMTTDNGNVITGTFRDGLEDGMVTIRQADGLVLRGEKHGETMRGMWTFEWPDRRVYAELADGRRGDYGDIFGVSSAKIEYFYTGDIYLGEVNAWLEPHGYGRIEKKNGTIVTGEWTAGEQTRVDQILHR